MRAECGSCAPRCRFLRAHWSRASDRARPQPHPAAPASTCSSARRCRRPAMVAHLVGLQAQENLPPYLSLAARLDGFDPHDVTRGLEDRSLVRLLTMRGTIHVLAARRRAGAARLGAAGARPRAQGNQNTRAGRHVARDELVAAVDGALADGPLPVKALGEAMAERFPACRRRARARRARRVPLVQVPPRGLLAAVRRAWSTDRSRPLAGPAAPTLDAGGVVRRYLAAFGPATAADMTTWSGSPGSVRCSAGDGGPGPARRARRAAGRYDVPGGEIVDGDVPAPPRLLGDLRQRVALARRARPR